MHDALKKGFSAQSRPPICARYPPHSCTSSSESSQGTSVDVPHPTSDDMRASQPTCGPPCAAGAHLVLVNFTFRARISSSLPPKARRYRGLVVRWGPAAAPDAHLALFSGPGPPQCAILHLWGGEGGSRVQIPRAWIYIQICQHGAAAPALTHQETGPAQSVSKQHHIGTAPVRCTAKFYRRPGKCTPAPCPSGSEAARGSLVPGQEPAPSYPAVLSPREDQSLG